MPTRDDFPSIVELWIEIFTPEMRDMARARHSAMMRIDPKHGMLILWDRSECDCVRVIESLYAGSSK